MDGAVLRILLLTLLCSGFCALSSSFPNVYNFSNQMLFWSEAQNNCISEYFAMEENATATTNTNDSVELCLNESVWTWINWQDYDGFCAETYDNESWTEANCSNTRLCVCHNEGVESYVILRGKTVTDSLTSCENDGDVLVSFSDAIMETKVKSLQFAGNMWISLVRLKRLNFLKQGNKWEPDDQNGTDNCAILFTDGRWTEALCDPSHPSTCSGGVIGGNISPVEAFTEIKNARKTVVRIKIQSSKNMEDPANSASLLQQLGSGLAKQGLTDFKLTWKKPPAKTVEIGSCAKL